MRAGMIAILRGTSARDAAIVTVHNTQSPCAGAYLLACLRKSILRGLLEDGARRLSPGSGTKRYHIPHATDATKKVPRSSACRGRCIASLLCTCCP